MEIALINRFNWSLKDIDETDMESLIPFVTRLTKGENPSGKEAQGVFVDQADEWL